MICPFGSIWIMKCCLRFFLLSALGIRRWNLSAGYKLSGRALRGACTPRGVHSAGVHSAGRALRGACTPRGAIRKSESDGDIEKKAKIARICLYNFFACGHR